MLLCLACYDECKEDGTTTTQSWVISQKTSGRKQQGYAECGKYEGLSTRQCSPNTRSPRFHRDVRINSRVRYSASHANQQTTNLSRLRWVK